MAGHTVFVIPSLNLSNSIGPGDVSHSGFSVVTNLRADDSDSEISYDNGMVRTCSGYPLAVAVGDIVDCH